MNSDKVVVNDYDPITGCINVSYDDSYFSDISYDNATGEITFTYNNDIIISFSHVLIAGLEYECQYQYEIETNALVNIEGVDFPCPSDYKMTSTTLVNNGRNTKGVVVGEIIREGVRKIELTWNYLTSADFEFVMSTLESGFILNVIFYDTILGQQTNKDFYAGDRVGMSALQTLDENGKIIGYQNVKVSLVEV